MKLRNKKTGEIVETDYKFGVSIPTDRFIGCKNYDQIAEYNSLAELNEEWEDAPAEPLIKDEKVRKAVRAWAEAVDANSAYVEKGCYENDQFGLSDGMAEIYFRISTPEGIRFYKRYTIAELCGEEEE